MRRSLALQVGRRSRVGGRRQRRRHHGRNPALRLRERHRHAAHGRQRRQLVRRQGACVSYLQEKLHSRITICWPLLDCRTCTHATFEDFSAHSTAIREPMSLLGLPYASHPSYLNNACIYCAGATAKQGLLARGRAMSPCSPLSGG